MATYDPDQSEMNEQASDNIIVNNNGKRLEESIDYAISNYVSTKKRENECATNSNRLQNNGGYVFDYERNRGHNKRFKRENESFGYDYNHQKGNPLAGYSGSGRVNHHRLMEESTLGNSSSNFCGNSVECFKIKDNYKPTGPPKLEYIHPDIEVKELGARLDASLNFNKYESIEVKVSGNDRPKWISSFLDSGLLKILLENIQKCNFLIPTPIQKYAIPVIMSGRDILASAQTGSGKTAAYVLSILHGLLSNPTELIFDNRHCEPHVIIMAPTRELTIQICKSVQKFSKGTNIRRGVLNENQSCVHQMFKIAQRGIHILAVTPENLKKFVNLGIVTLGSVKFFIIDEVDKMLDIILPDMEFIMNHPTLISNEMKQTIMFSATFSSEIQQMAASYLKSDYILVTIDKIGEARKDIVQTVISVTKFKKTEALLNLLKDMVNCHGTIVFVNGKQMADYIAAFLFDQNFRTTSIHSDYKQKYQVISLNNFNDKKTEILVTQRVATCEYDIKGINNIINFDLPNLIEEYIYHIGRYTCGLGNAGKYISFFDPDSDGDLAAKLITVLKQAEQEIPLWLHDFAGQRQITQIHNDFEDIRRELCNKTEDDS